MTKNTSYFSYILHIFVLTLVSGLFFSGTFAGETTGSVSTGVSTGTSGTVISAPELTPIAGMYTSIQSVSFDVQGAVYSCFTTDSTDPACNWDALTCAAGTKYSAALSIAATTTVKAVSCYAGGNTSSIGSDVYTISISTSSSSGGGGGGGSSSSYVYVDPNATIAETATVVTPENSTSGIDACTNYFTDTSDHWAKKYICFLKEKGIVNGKNSGEESEESEESEINVKFSPEDSITRAEVIKIAVLGFEIPEISESESKNIQNFPDISSSDWYEDYVLRAKNAEIVNGRKDGTFDPNSPITRAEAVKILLLSSKTEILSDDAENSGENVKNFSDVPDYAWYYDVIQTAQHLKIISGKSDGKFYPEDNITRAEFSKIAALLLEK